MSNINLESKRKSLVETHDTRRKQFCCVFIVGTRQNIAENCDAMKMDNTQNGFG